MINVWHLLITFSRWTASPTCFGAGEERTMTCQIVFIRRSFTSQDIRLTLQDTRCSSTPKIKRIPTGTSAHHRDCDSFICNFSQLAADRVVNFRFKYLYSGAKRMSNDGYNSLKYKRVKLELNRLYTWILVDLPHLKPWNRASGLSPGIGGMSLVWYEKNLN